jgi:hypothetical protein
MVMRTFYVVRIEHPDDHPSPDWKVFEHHQDAKRRYSVGHARWPDEVASVAMFQADADDVRQAVEQVKAGKATLLKHCGPV